MYAAGIMKSEKKEEQVKSLSLFASECAFNKVFIE